MSSSRRDDLLLPLLTVLSDAVAIEAAFLAAYWLRFQSTLFDHLGFVQEAAPAFEGYLLASLAVVLAWLLLFHSRKMYSTRRDVTLADELFNVIKVISIGMLVMLSVAFFYREISYSRVVIGLLWGFSIIFVFSGRSIVHLYERSLYRRGLNLQPAVILGRDGPAGRVFEKLNLHSSFGFDITGYFADEPAAADSPLRNAHYLGTFLDAPPIISRMRNPIAFIAVRPEDHPALFELIARCEGVNIEFMMVPDILEILTSNVKVRELEGIPFLKIKSIPLSTWGRISKRAFDLAASLVLLVASSPLVALIAVLIKIDSRGPVLFTQKRVGLDGREFTMYKFRSMTLNAARADNEAGLGIRNDPRRTRIGKWLRTTSFDELPQLLNVLKGEMSLVGPRPERTHFVREFQSMIPKYLDRHRVKTGMTGWAQVNGFRGDTSLAERIKFDLYYIENWSVGFDIKILLRTIRAAFSSQENSGR